MSYNQSKTKFLIVNVMFTGGGCRYAGKLYHQGEQWKDGCKYKCVCVNALTGYYKCEHL